MTGKLSRKVVVSHGMAQLSNFCIADCITDSGLKVTKKNYHKDLKKTVVSSGWKTFWSWRLEICTGWSPLTLILVGPRFSHNNIGKKVETV